MKKIWIFVCFMLCLPLISFCQHPGIQNFYHKYAGYENSTNIDVDSWLIKLTATSIDDENVHRVLNKITYLRILLMNDGQVVEKQDLQKLIKNLQKDTFDELISVKDKGEHIRFFIKEQADSITDVILLVSGSDGFVLISLEGTFSFKDLQHLDIDIEGGEYLKKIPKNRA